MPHVTTNIFPATIVPSFDADGVTVNGLKVGYDLVINHNGTPQADKVRKQVEIWADLNPTQKQRVQDLFDNARTFLEG